MVKFFAHLLVAPLLVFSCAAGVGAQTHDGSDPDSLAPLPITAAQRVKWVVKSTVAPRSLAAGVFTSAIQTAENRPREYGPHGDGFGKRYGIWLTGVATERSMEASLGALWGEDPRYFRADDNAFKGRMKHIIVMTFAARRADGELAPAYARFVAFPASNFLSNTWRADSIANSSDAIGRTAMAFVGKLAGNAVAEYWPDLKNRIRRKD